LSGITDKRAVQQNAQITCFKKITFKHKNMSLYKVEILSFNTINELPGSWQKSDFLALLSTMDYADPEEINDAELKEMCMLSLADFEPAEAAKIVLDYVINERLTDGQIENLSHEIMTEKLWEEYPELSLHPDLYRATQLLYQAYNGKFPRTEAVQFQLKITAGNAEELSLFDENAEAPIVRLLAAGMSDHSLIHRLYADQVGGTSFEDAKNILWQLKELSKDETSVTYDIVSSSYWLDEIKYADTFEAESHADVPVDEED
jgi:hypothetical protein